MTRFSLCSWIPNLLFEFCENYWIQTIETEGPTHTVIQVTPATPTLKTDSRGEHALDALLEELQTFAKHPPNLTSGSKKPGRLFKEVFSEDA